MKATPPKANAAKAVRPDFAKQALLALKAYRRTGRAADWKDVKRKLGL